MKTNRIKPGNITRMKLLRQSQGLSQNKLANMITSANVKALDIAALENISSTAMQEIADALGWSGDPQDLLEEFNAAELLAEVSKKLREEESNVN